MKPNDDFERADVPEDTKCASYKCENTARDMPFYLTEWEIKTGASTDGLYYCEECATGA